MRKKRILMAFKGLPKFIRDIPEAIFAIVLIVFVLLFLYIFDNSDFIQDYFPGLMLDIAIFGVLIVIYKNIWDRRQERKNNIIRWQEEIDDFRKWDEKEAVFRIIGNIKRLNRMGVTKIDLNNCYLKNADLHKLNFKEAIFIDADLEGANLNQSNLQGANLIRANLRNADLGSTDLQGTTLSGIDLQGADLSYANLERAIISESMSGAVYKGWIKPNLRETILLGTIFKDADLTAADLRGAIVAEVYKSVSKRPSIHTIANFQGANLTMVDLRGLKVVESGIMGKHQAKFEEFPGFPKEPEIIMELLSVAKFLSTDKLDPELATQIKEKYPHPL